MALNGLFTYEDLYGGKSPNYYHRPLPEITTSSVLSILRTPTTAIVPTSYVAKLVSSTDVESTTKLNQFAIVIPFTYFYWILVVVAILLTLILVIVFICYCRTFIKDYRAQRRTSLSSFNRQRTVNQPAYAHNIYQRAATPPSPPSPRIVQTPPCPSKSLKSLDDQLYRQSLDIVVSPQIARHDVFLKEPLSTFSSSTSDLHSCFSARSSDPPLQVEHLYESQRASLGLNDEPKNDSLIVDLN